VLESLSIGWSLLFTARANTAPVSCRLTIAPGGRCFRVAKRSKATGRYGHRRKGKFSAALFPYYSLSLLLWSSNRRDVRSPLLTSNLVGTLMSRSFSSYWSGAMAKPSDEFGVTGQCLRPGGRLRTKRRKRECSMANLINCDNGQMQAPRLCYRHRRRLTCLDPFGSVALCSLLQTAYDSSAIAYWAGSNPHEATSTVAGLFICLPAVLPAHLALNKHAAATGRG
jgi:hypothetical protein